MRYILIFIFFSMCCLKLKSQIEDSKIIYLKVIEKITGKYKWRNDIILIYDSTMNWRAKEDYMLLSMLRRRRKSENDDWVFILQNFNLCPQPGVIKNYFNLSDIPKVDGVKFRYVSQKPAANDIFGYWRISFSPLYFNVDSTNCFAVADFLIGKCGNGANRTLYFRKNEEGLWVDAKPFFID